MSINVGDQLLDGQVVVVSVSDDLITSITFPNIKDSLGNALNVTYNPGQTLPSILELAGMILSVFG